LNQISTTCINDILQTQDMPQNQTSPIYPINSQIILNTDLSTSYILVLFQFLELISQKI
jgi:hypothetical protein